MNDWHRPYAAYLFDLDGTLIDTAPDLMTALNHALGTVGLDAVDEALTRHWVGHGARAMIVQALAQHASPHSPDDLLPSFMAHYQANCAVNSRAYPGVVETLSTLKARGARLAVVTNKITRFSTEILDQLELNHLFDAIVCGDTAAAPKPAPDPVLYCLDALEVAPDAALFVGDSNTDVEAARAANVPVVCVRDGYNHGVDVETLNPDGVIDRFEELL